MQRWLIDPIQEQRKLIGEIVFAVVYYANLFNYNAAFRHTINARYKLEELSGRRAELLDETYGTLKERTEEATTRLRRLSSQIHQSMQVIPCYWLLEKLGIVYSREKLCAVSNDLIKWANAPELETTIVCQNSIIHNLNLRHLISEAEKNDDWQQPLTNDWK